MAEGYARASKRPGVVLVTSGPGVTNTITPMCDAMKDGTPIVVLCGQVPITTLGSNAFQEVDALKLSSACTKWNARVTCLDEIVHHINKAFSIATSGRPGPVLIELPKDVMVTSVENRLAIDMLHQTLPDKTSRDHVCNEILKRDIAHVADLISSSQRPMILAGQGIKQSRHGCELLRELAHKALIPVATSLLGIGSFDETDSISLGMIGMHGSVHANTTVQHADLILVLGARLDDRATMDLAKFAPLARRAAENGRGGIIQFEIEPENVNTRLPVTKAILGDVGESLELLVPELCRASTDERAAWFAKIEAWKTKSVHVESLPSVGLYICPKRVITELCNLVACHQTQLHITTGVGQHQMWSAQHFAWRYPLSFITSGGLGTMGYGLPACIGAKIANPDALVIDVDGDASFNMTMAELLTASQYGIIVKVIILNNEEQGMVTQWQNLLYADRFSHSHQQNPDYVQVANAMGFQSKTVATTELLRDSLVWLIESQVPALLEVKVNQKVLVQPMVQNKSGLDEFQTWDEGTYFNGELSTRLIYNRR